MIPVQRQSEPPDFDRVVRQPGLRALMELIGASGLAPRSGRPRKAIVGVTRIEDIPAASFPPYWVDCLDDLCRAYNRVCAYTAFYIHEVTGARSVDHFIPKAMGAYQAYEWSNYRLACGLINSRKKDYLDVLDPFLTLDNWFHLELVGFQVIPNPVLENSIKVSIQATIDRLLLNDSLFTGVRAKQYNEIMSGEVGLVYLMKYSPFLAKEMVRQGMVSP